MKKQTLLIEIGTEELPARLIDQICFNFYNNFVKELNMLNITYKKIAYFSTPRRLALKIQDINTQEKFIEIQKKGPSVINAYDQNGYLTKSAIHWLKHCKINIQETTRLKTNKGEWLLYKKKQKQEKIELLIPKITESALKKIFLIKPMRWEISNQKFFRPIRNIVMLLDNKIILGKIFNINSQRILHNHIAFKEKTIVINNAKDYPTILFTENNIIAEYTIRKQIIIKKIEENAKKVNSFIKTNNILIDEITSLVESPTAFLATFKKKFLKIPPKILEYVIEKQQKCIPLYNSKQNILSYFIFVSNINPAKPKKIITGNEKVMHARLADINFFLNNDRKTSLENHLISLKQVLFQNDLGSLYDKTFRLKYLIKWISQYNFSNIEDAMRAAMLSKCDLVTNIVCEFPDLQGTIGMYYALENQEKKDIALALEEQYLPCFSGDKLPKSSIGCALSISDKMDTLSGMFHIGNIPSSNKDPFALRRLAIGILRIIIEKNIPLDLKKLISQSLLLYDNKYINHSDLSDQIFTFFISRLFYWYQELGYSVNIIKSVLSYELTQPIDIHARIKAITFFQKSKYLETIILFIKRIINILEKEKKILSGNINIKLMKQEEEIILFNKIHDFNNHTKTLFLEKKYKDILFKIKDFEKPIYNFFEKVKIYHSDAHICLNRLLLLNYLKKIFFKITNFSHLY
ncbi:glycine--tRNA ligase subunit beta [Buchnera aphidicola (Macrosiphoniella sanborni)]|uniref:Glycine--tRNA ligase beta subunit n=1 Tax=Buchnera aphidicola (Macrosiphoniella sanborni) TaxID=1241865 RepID=A0A4D6YB54_9GAMM|nr:glycine--tRNA ligase subunit beta [Buchnera aphidicola]QCI23691.1 glycine--tRNA ligase subunit beta [Buchnera aphidicola (Macrosiphoniella sanborni)]